MLSLPARLPRPVVVLTLTTLLISLCSPAARADGVGDAIRAHQHDTWATRITTLRDVGFRNTITLNDAQSRQEFYLPVPRGMALTDGAVHFNSNYLKAETGTATLLLSIDGSPVSATKLDAVRGDARQRLAVPAVAHESGFVRVGVEWASATPLKRCETTHTLGNVLIIDPDTQLRYRYDTAALASVDDAWSALPGSPLILISGQHLSEKAFDSAWRLGVALARAGKQASVRAFPVVGDQVDLGSIALAPALSALPAFSALGGKNVHRFENMAEIGAWIMISPDGVLGDIAVVEDTLAGLVGQAMDALRVALADSPDGLAAFDAWRASRTTLEKADGSAHKIELATLGAATVIAVSAQSGGWAADALEDDKRSMLVNREALLMPQKAAAQDATRGTRLIRLGGTSTQFDVLARGDWSSNLPLSALSRDGRIPQELVLDVAMSPGASPTRPVVSLFWNDILLAARQMNADGTSERMVARVPGYVLGVDNMLRVSFQRQPVSADCNEVPQGFPANVLPSSYISANDSKPDGTFGGIMPLLAGSPELLIPAAYLNDAPTQLLRVIRLAAASGLTPSRSALVVVATDQAAAPKRPFLSLATVLVSESEHVSGNQPGIVHMTGHETRWRDAQGVSQVSTAEVVRAGEQYGLLWHAVSEQDDRIATRGIVTGARPSFIPADLIAWVRGGEQASTSAWREADMPWGRYLSWGMPAVLIATLGFIVLLFAAWAARSRKTKK